MSKFDFSTLWKHYSSYFLAVILAIGAAQEYVPEFKELLPHWMIVILAIGGLVAKTIKQQAKENGVDLEQKS